MKQRSGVLLIANYRVMPHTSNQNARKTFRPRCSVRRLEEFGVKVEKIDKFKPAPLNCPKGHPVRGIQAGTWSQKTAVEFLPGETSFSLFHLWPKDSIADSTEDASPEPLDLDDKNL